MEVRLRQVRPAATPARASHWQLARAVSRALCVVCAPCLVCVCVCVVGVLCLLNTHTHIVSLIALGFRCSFGFPTIRPTKGYQPTRKPCGSRPLRAASARSPRKRPLGPRAAESRCGHRRSSPPQPSLVAHEAKRSVALQPGVLNGVGGFVSSEPSPGNF